MVSKENLNLVNITQKKWADIILEIGKAYKQKINLDNLIFELLNNVYAFNQGEVIFKPTLAKHNQFRSTKDEFISYFLGPFFAEKIIFILGYTEFFIYAATFSCISFSLMLFVMDEESDSEIEASSFFLIIKENKLFKILFANFLLASGFGVVMNFLSLFLKERSLSIGLFFVGYSIVVSLSRILLSKKISSKNIFYKILIMLSFFSITIFLVPEINNIFHVIIFSVVFSFTYSLVYPLLSSIALTGTSKSLSGRIFGAINSSFSIGVNVMTFFFGFIAEIYGFNIMFKSSAIIIFLGVFLLYFAERGKLK